MTKRKRPPILVALIALGLFVPGAWIAPKMTQAMPPFAQAYGLKCSACHTMVPLLNSYGRYVQRTGYAALDRKVLAKALPVWVGEAMNYDSTAGAGTGTPRFSFGNLDIHAIGYATPDITYHVQQWIVADDQSGPLDTLWVSYNNLMHRNGHLFIGKTLNPAPSPYSQTFDLDGPSASSTVVGEHDWGATWDNRWGTKLAYVHGVVDLEAGYYLSGDDLNGITDFNPGDKTFQWKAAYAAPKHPVEVGVFGSNGSIPVSAGSMLDRYSSVAGYVQIDPDVHGRPGFLGIYQSENDANPGIGDNGTPLGPTASRGASLEVFEPVFRGNTVVSLRHDFNDSGAGGAITNGTSINVGFNVPWTKYLHGYLESNLGGNSDLAGASGGPTWKGMVWLTIPIAPLRK